MANEALGSANPVSRRGFLRAMFGVGLGVAIGAGVTPSLAEFVDSETEGLTGATTGNAGFKQKIVDGCPPDLDEAQCLSEWNPSGGDVIQLTVEAPITEEIMFRGIPSMLLDTVFNKGEIDTMPVSILRGTDDFKFTKREIITGVASSAIFGAAHNITGTGFDMKTIPASQTVDGLLYWCLTRKFGLPASIVAHASHNVMSL